MSYSLNVERFAALVRTQRGSRGLREAAAEIGQISASTLSRIENGSVPDMETFLLVCSWLKVAPALFFQSTEGTVPPQSGDTAEALALLIRSDTQLNPATADALARLIRVAYPDLRAL